MPHAFHDGGPHAPRAPPPGTSDPTAAGGLNGDGQVLYRSAITDAVSAPASTRFARRWRWILQKPLVQIPLVTWGIALTASAGLWFLLYKAVLLFLRWAG